MQEPKVDVDTDLVWKVNDAINNPGGSGSSRAGGTNSSSATTSEQEMHTLLQSMSQSQLMQLLGGSISLCLVVLIYLQSNLISLKFLQVWMIWKERQVCFRKWGWDNWEDLLLPVEKVGLAVGVVLVPLLQATQLHPLHHPRPQAAKKRTPHLRPQNQEHLVLPNPQFSFINCKRFLVACSNCLLQVCRYLYYYH